MHLRRLTPSGITAFQDYLIQLSDNPSKPVPVELLENQGHTEAIKPAIAIEAKQLPKRYDAAEYLNCILGAREETHDVLDDVGMWAWLTLYFFEQVCPVDSKGNRKVKELACYIPNVRDYRKYYRHSLAGPYRVYRAHKSDPEKALSLLVTPLHSPGEVVEQMAAVQGILTAPGAVAAITKLYYDPQSQKIKRGAAGKERGSARRLRDFLNQLDLTWDLYSITADHLLTLLPPEYDRFK